ncbi:MAG: hypothetical protein WBE41_22015, partial [Terracidiphilus sp.]
QALARPHGVSPFRKELNPDQRFGQTRLNPDGSTRPRVRWRARAEKSRSDVRFGDFSLMGQDQALFAANAANTDNQVASGIVWNQPCILSQ